MNVAQLIDNGVDADEAGAIAARWNSVYGCIREELTARVKTTKTLGGDPTRLKELRRELGQLDRCAHRACTQSPPGFSARAALRLIQEALRYLPLELQGDTHRLAALLADWARVKRDRAERAARHAEVDRRG
ncbi:hypothetical protein RND61_30760 [Streptomyces sp. TRM76323]|uniref:Uncharacterized protein n=1 Tax=Streptomyces tamarix TaxID=3078565 RepID=A0ABU3QUF3_9ACTN|nr:hypothetical protein [Streptomyces tamarix]MDT9686420.1 hypothetical protein [Streptomyces tamarix]